MVCSRGESLTTHRNQMKNVGLLAVGLISATLLVGCESSKSSHGIVPVMLSENMQQYAVDKFAYAHCITGARGLSNSAGGSGHFGYDDLSKSVKAIISACSTLK